MISEKKATERIQNWTAEAVSMPDTKIKHRPIATLVPWARNARIHSKKQVRQIAASIRQFGFTNPVLCQNSALLK